MQDANFPFSIIIPTFKEAKNIIQLIEAIQAINFDGRDYEIIIVDDNSQDGTEEIIKQLKSVHTNLRFIKRFNKKGLSRSVIEGITQARFDACIIMDADLSHPPNKIPEMLKRIEENKVDLILGSRFIPGSSFQKENYRQFFSKLSSKLLKIFLKLSTNDPLSGFIGIKKKTYLAHAHKINPIGWKIGLELMIKCDCKKIEEIPIHFSERIEGKSKLSVIVIIQFIQHLALLFRYQWFRI